MNNLTKVLLGGAALCALTAVPAAAESAGRFNITALHAGRMVDKTKMHKQGATQVTSTASVFTYVPFSEYYRHRQPLLSTFFKYNNGGDPCSNPPQKVTVEPKKTQYGKASIVVETISTLCDKPVKYYGAAYKITDPNAQGNDDFFRVIDQGRFTNSGTKYRGTLYLDINLVID